MGLIAEFKTFAMRGNVVDMATGIIIGGAFGKIVSSLVNDVLMPPIGLLLGNMDFSSLAVTIRDKTAEAEAVTIRYGAFVNTVLDFVIVAFAIFIVIKQMNRLKKREQPGYRYFFTGIRIGDDFAIVTNPDELFCEIGMAIKKRSPFRHTMVAEQTNGAHGYVPTSKAFEGGSYETWFGEHSYLTTRAGEIIEKESLDILNCLKR